mmetsp:Transcript_54978/g.131373  ORF Transcript_54978/g.131373 Transcript_54978/m.131373 type:complete len:80 (+) Transcript_54978:2175-2414(+)
MILSKKEGACGISDEGRSCEPTSSRRFRRAATGSTKMWSATRWPIDRNYARLQAARGRTNLIFVDTAAISMYRSDRHGS